MESKNEKCKYDGKYNHIFRPLVLPNGVVLKNRMASSNSTPYHMITTFQNYPNDAVFQTMVNRAKGGAALLMLNFIKEENYCNNYLTKGSPDVFYPKAGKMYYQPEDWMATFLDVNNKKFHVKYVEMTEAIHMQGSKILQQFCIYCPEGYDVSEGDSNSVSIFNFGGAPAKELTKEMLKAEKDKWVELAVSAMHCGFDGITIHMFNEISMPSKMLSERTNHRTDEYGGNMENRTRWFRDLCSEVKKQCGKKFIIHASMSTEDPRENGIKLPDIIEFGKLCDGLLDMISVRHYDTNFSMISSYEPDQKYPVLEGTHDIKQAFVDNGINIAVSSIGGYCEPMVIEDALKNEKFDMAEMARAYISNPNLGRLIRDGREDDIIPCLRCNKCHHRGIYSKVWAISQCAVNPEIGLEHKLPGLITPATVRRNVGIIGGGPAGLRAAIYAADRGHDVVVYEKSDRLGGMLKALDGVDFKWVLTEYKDWLIRQVGKRDNIKVMMNTEVTPGFLEGQGHDAVITAIGGKQNIPPIKGIEKAQTCVSILMDKTIEVGKNVVIVGGGDIGVDCGLYLAKTGHKVFVIEMAPYLAMSSVIMHSYTHKQEAWEAEPNFDFVTEASVKEIKSNGVTYTDAEGKEHTAKANTVLFSVGMSPTADEAVKLVASGSAETCFIGDCKEPASIAEATRDAFGAASML